MRASWQAAIIQELRVRMHFPRQCFIFANEDIRKNVRKPKSGDIGVVMGVDGLDGVQLDLRLRSREKAHEVMLIGWVWSGKITHDPEMFPARKKRCRAGASEHSKSSRSAGASEHKDEPPAIPDNPLREALGFDEREVDFGDTVQ